ncbi:hypothetical protein MSPP1_002826 [Malassezia sp. CBS 17886]|nr:hypothetical protein MSPP1_002826 [Malassezia sp. CBS 17886]
MFALPEPEKNAFFALLDEYFSERPHLVPNYHAPAVVVAVGHASSGLPAAKKAPPPPPPRRESDDAPGARTSATSSPPSHSMYHREIQRPAGLETARSIGGINTTSAGAAFRSMASNVVHRKTDSGSSDDYYKGGAPAAGIAHSTPRYPQATPSDASGGTTHASSTPSVYGATEEKAPASQHMGGAEARTSEAMAVALYAFQGAEAGDLSVQQGDRLILLEPVTDDWWRARSTDGEERVGIVPANYIERL